MRRRPAALLSALSVLLLLTACGGEPSPRERLRAAFDTTAAQPTAAYSMELSARSAGDTTSRFALTGEGVYDSERRTGRMTLELGAMGLSMEIISNRDSVYARLPSVVTGADDRWVGGAKPDTAALDDAWTMDGEAAGHLLDAAEGDIRSLGSDQIDGTAVDGFGFTVAVGELAEKLKTEAEDEGEVSPAVRKLKMPVEVWIDDRDRVRRMSASMAMDPLSELAKEAASDADTVPGLGQRQALGSAMVSSMLSSLGDSLVMTLRFRDFGQPVDVQGPSGVEVMSTEELGELMQKRQRQGAGSGLPGGR